MKKVFILFSVIIFYTSLFSVIEESDSFKGFMFGHAPNCEYDNWLSHVAEGIASEGYNIYAPFDRQTNGFGDFKIMNSADSLNWAGVIELFLAGQLDAAQDLINSSGFPYETVIFHDTDYNRTYYMLREIPDSSYVDDNGTPDDTSDDEVGAFTYGWGLYVYYPDGPYPHITTAPHPNDDFPSVPMAYEVFTIQQSKFLLISGTGREVKWTHIGYYNNSKSLCDPSRVSDHPFNIAYRKFCDAIRDEFGKREFSIQVHSYDWGVHHAGRTNVQISGGNQVSNPDLPIRDNSSLKLDLINATPLVVHPANDLGIHPPVYINDFYGVHCTEFPFTYSNGDTTFAVNTDIDLPGYSANRQMQYTQSGFNQYDNFEPFFHIEMDEFPNCYPQTTENYQWFYSWNPATGKYDYDHLFDRFIDYYIPWVNALASVLPYVYQMNDNLIPVAPSDLSVKGECAQNVTISWTPGDSYDIYSYEILYSTEPIENGNYQIIDRSNDIHLASLATTSRTFYGLTPNTDYYFKIRIKDKNDNYSDLSNEITAHTGSADITFFKAVGDSTFIKLNWHASVQDNCYGFNVFRKAPNSPQFEQIASWQTDSELICNPETTEYAFNDSTCVQNTLYTYKISYSDDTNLEYFYQNEKQAVARYIGKLVFAQDTAFALKDTCFFGYNEMASDSYDADYDEYKNYTQTGDYFFCQFYEEHWNSNKTMKKETKGYYDSYEKYKTWVIRFKTSQINVPVKVHLANFAQRNTQRIYLNRNNQWINIGDGEEYTFTPTTNGYYTFTLYYGNYTPAITFIPQNYYLYYPNDTINFQWIIDNIIPVNHINVYASTPNFDIPIAHNLPADTQEISWNVPPVIADNIALRIDLVLAQNDTVKYYSPYKFGIIYPQVAVSVHTGWNTITKNFDTENETTQDIYGETAEFYQLNQNDEFEQIEEPQFTKPYWIYSSEDYYHNVSNPELLRIAYQYPVSEGWNLVPNPYSIDFLPSQLVFEYNNQYYKYYQAVSMNLIEASFFGYDNRFEPTDKLYAGKSYYLYSYASNLTIIFLPYLDSFSPPNEQPDWHLTITSSIENNPEESAISIVGSKNLQDSLYYPTWDFLKPTLKPFEDAPVLVLKNDFGFGENNYYQLTQNYNPETDTVEKIYNAQLLLNQPSEVNFSLQPFHFPDNYRVYLKFGDNYLLLSEDSNLSTFIDTTTCDFQILVTDFEHLASSEDIVSANGKVFNYPNPFNPSTTISFYTKENNTPTKIKIYNIKGQLVKTLLNENLKKGEHKIVWNGTNNSGKTVSTGVYFFKLMQKDQKTVIRKMMLIK